MDWSYPVFIIAKNLTFQIKCEFIMSRFLLFNYSLTYCVQIKNLKSMYISILLLGIYYKLSKRCLHIFVLHLNLNAAWKTSFLIQSCLNWQVCQIHWMYCALRNDQMKYMCRWRLNTNVTSTSFFFLKNEVFHKIIFSSSI